MVWNTIAEKILQLNDLDRQCQAFGAAKHRYAFRPVLSTDHLKEFERDHAFQIPDELRKVYLELGNGGIETGVFKQSVERQLAAPGGGNT